MEKLKEGIGWIYAWEVDDNERRERRKGDDKEEEFGALAFLVEARLGSCSLCLSLPYRSSRFLIAPYIWERREFGERRL